jgi:hypothetical protein
MVPRDVYETFPEEERRLWHSHEYEVKSGMLILPKPAAIEDSEWEKAELAAMKEPDSKEVMILRCWRRQNSFLFENKQSNRQLNNTTSIYE